MTNVITTRAEYDRATQETKRLHEAISDELKADIREAAEGHALAIFALTRARLAYLNENATEWEAIRKTLPKGDGPAPEEIICDVCGLTLDDDKGSQCYNQTHSIECDVFFELADPSNPEGCDDQDCVICCECARCASGDVRHCPECGPNEGEDDCDVQDGCPMCEGTGAVSRSRS